MSDNHNELFVETELDNNNNNNQEENDVNNIKVSKKPKKEIDETNELFDTLTKEHLMKKNEELYKNTIEFKDLDFLLEKKLFYKNQLSHLYDMQQQIRRFELQIRDNIRELQDEMYKKCHHNWVRGPDAGFDQSLEYYCTICENDYRHD